MERWKPGDVVIIRYVETPTSVKMLHAISGRSVNAGGQPFLVDGRIVTVQARAYRVIEDTPARIVLFQPEGTRLPKWHVAEQRMVPNPSTTRGETIRVLLPECGFDVTLMFETTGEPPWFYTALFDGDGLKPGWRESRDRLVGSASSGRGTPGRFRGWYVNIEAISRADYGFDVVDQTLDIIVRPDRSWYWKDEDEIATALAAEACTLDYAAAIRRAGEHAVALIEAGASPFDEEWMKWRTPEGWLRPIEVIPDGWQLPPALIEE